MASQPHIKSFFWHVKHVFEIPRCLKTIAVTSKRIPILLHCGEKSNLIIIVSLDVASGDVQNQASEGE
jgi:hypothetical protein